MSLFDLSQELRNDIMNVGTALNNKLSRDEVSAYSETLAVRLDSLDGIWNCNNDISRRAVSDFIEIAIEELTERKKELDSMTVASLLAGNDVPGFQLAAGRITRKVNNKIAAESSLSKYIDKDALFESKMIGIPKMESMLKGCGLKSNQVESVISKFVTVTTGKPILAKTKIK